MIQTSGTLQTNGAKIAYEVEGTGTPVLFIHAGIANMRMWDHQVAGLRDRYRLIKPPEEVVRLLWHVSH